MEIDNSKKSNYTSEEVGSNLSMPLNAKKINLEQSVNINTICNQFGEKVVGPTNSFRSICAVKDENELCSMQLSKSTYKTDRNLRTTENTNRIKPFKCNQCNKRFTDSSGLIVHQLVHSGVRPFQCNQCNKRFTDSSGLIVHQRVHSGVRPFRCNQCNKQFTQKSALARHQPTHS